MPEAKPKRVYTPEEVNAILSRAIERQRSTEAGAAEGMTREELVDAAREAGISPDAVAAAAEDLESEREGDADLREARARAASGFRAHLFTYLPVIAFLIIVNALTSSYPWAIWPALGWGLALVLHMRRAVFPSAIEQQGDARRRAERRRRLEERRLRKESRRQMQQGAKELGKAVERGVATLLTGTAKALHEELDRVAEGAPQDARARARVDEGAKARPRVDADEPAKKRVDEDAREVDEDEEPPRAEKRAKP